MNGYDTGVEDDDDNKSFVDDWEWDMWTPIDDYYDVPGPPIHYFYHGKMG